MILLGIDESQGFAACPVYDTKKAQQAVVSMARQALKPSVQVITDVVAFEGEQVVVLGVLEAPAAGKPVRVIASGQAYLRQYDGTYPLSELEEQAFVAARTQPLYDRDPVAGSSMSDLDVAAVASFVRTRRAHSSVFSGWSDSELLAHAGVVTAEGEVSVAGLLALGVFPQRFFPSLSIQASSWSGRRSRSAVLDSAVIEGPVASMLDDAQAWVARNTATALVERDGNVHDEPQFPPRAVRELVANALVHRDLGPYALGRYVSLVLEPGRLTITNPGGLYGVSVEALGHTDSSLRNASLASVLLSVQSPSGGRVIERLGSGIPAARDAMRRASLPDPQFHDTGITFAAVLSSAPPPVARMTAPLTKTQSTVATTLAKGPATVAEVSERTGLTPRQVRHALASLTEADMVTTDGSGRNVRHSLRPNSRLTAA
ncbi:MAG: hypothetical protein FWF02_06065 [Micrococcales bacterium]|nr:hypothetical protein [Micrococcales bacterium]MCL2667256.1 hypothetical protein [Micrococcales bacterium]